MATDAVLSDAEVVERGMEIYEKQLRARLEPSEKGRFVVINPRNGDYSVGKSTTDAGRVMRAKYPDEVFYEVRVGYEVVTTAVSPRVPHAARRS